MSEADVVIDANKARGAGWSVGATDDGGLALTLGPAKVVLYGELRDRYAEAVARAVTPGQPAAAEPDKRMAVDPDGNVKPVSEFAPDEKWWCDGEDCGGGPLGPSLPVPHVHPYSGPALAVDLLTGRDNRPRD